jgi:hypothetical protein
MVGHGGVTSPPARVPGNQLRSGLMDMTMERTVRYSLRALLILIVNLFLHIFLRKCSPTCRYSTGA